MPNTAVSASHNTLRDLGGPPRLPLPLARGLQALDKLRDRPLTASELARALEVNRSTAHRLLGELEQAGYVVRDSVTRRFMVSPDKFSLSGSGPVVSGASDAAYDSTWGEVIYRVLRELRDLMGESTMFAVPARDRMLYVAFFGTDHPIGVQETIGSARPMHASAVGKAYLSALPPATLDVVLGRLDYSEGTENAATCHSNCGTCLTRFVDRATRSTATKPLSGSVVWRRPLSSTARLSSVRPGSMALPVGSRPTG